MAKIVIQGVEYPAPETFTNRELSMIKRISGVRSLEIKDAAIAGDNDLLVAVAMVVLTRAGQTPDLEKLMDLDVGEIDAKAEPGEEGYEDAGVTAANPPPAPAGGEVAAATSEMGTPRKLQDVSGARG